MGLYDASLETFKQNMRDQVPIIVALFSGQGRQMILYRPGPAPEVAPPVPIVYQLAKSVGHSTMAIYEVVSPYLSDPRANQMWRAPLQMYRTQNESALGGLGALDIAEDDRETMRAILQRNLAFMDQCITNESYSYEDVEEYIRGTTPLSVKTIGIASGAQVGHWMSVVEGWKNGLGNDWERLYAVDNTMYVYAAEQHPLQCPGPVHGHGDDGRPAVARRDGGVRDHPREDAGRARPQRRRPLTGDGILPRLLRDGCRASRRRRPGSVRRNWRTRSRAVQSANS